jgi:hypothetical protein
MASIKELKKACEEQRSCEGCPATRACKEFKTRLSNITQPWELHRLTDYEFSPIGKKEEEE